MTPTRFLGLFITAGIMGCGVPSRGSVPRDFDPALPEAPKGLERYVGIRPITGQDLHDLCIQFEELTGERLDAEKPGLEVSFVQRFESGPAGWILLQVHAGEESPGISFVVSHVFDRDWRILVTQTFPTGYRYFITDAAVVRQTELGESALVVKTAASSLEALSDRAHPPEARRFDRVEYFAFVQGRLELVRMENNQKQVERNSYTTRKPLDGPEPPNLSSSEWMGRLESGRIAERLAALVWLTGHHMASTASRPRSHSCEPVENSIHFEVVSSALGTQQTLRNLKTSQNRWLREYASLELITIER